MQDCRSLNVQPVHISLTSPEGEHHDERFDIQVRNTQANLFRNRFDFAAGFCSLMLIQPLVVHVVEQQEAGTTRTPTPTESLIDYSAYSEELRMAKMSSRPTPVQAGALNVSSRVQVVVEIQARL